MPIWTVGKKVATEIKIELCSWSRQLRSGATVDKWKHEHTLLLVYGGLADKHDNEFTKCVTTISISCQKLTNYTTLPRTLASQDFTEDRQ